MNLHDLSFDKNWTLFLDRDGVINRRIKDGYVTDWDGFVFLSGAVDAIRILAGIFGRVLVVSNQQGVGKGVVKYEEVEKVNERMCQEIENAGGRVDKVYFSPHLQEMNHPDRKPGTGMAMKAKREFPLIDLHRSVMVGDSLTDMQFGRNIGSVNVWITDPNEQPIPEDLYDLKYHSLIDFTNKLLTHNS
jgi:histidinol-phosphate phosphatase family protein